MLRFREERRSLYDGHAHTERRLRAQLEREQARLLHEFGRAVEEDRVECRAATRVLEESWLRVHRHAEESAHMQVRDELADVSLFDDWP